MTHLNKFYSLLFLLTLVLASCAKKNLEMTELIKLPKIKTARLIYVLDSLASYKPNYFYTKINCKYDDTTQHVSFKTSIRMVKDSAFSALISFATIPIYNSILTKDSLTIVNKREKCFSKEKLSYLKDNFGVAFEYVNVEELLLGLPVAFDSTQRYHHVTDAFNYIISSHKKREIRRNDRRHQDELIFKYYLTDDAKGMKKMMIDSPSDTTSVLVQYNSLQFVEGHNYPDEVELTVLTPRNKMVILLNYNKIDVIETQVLELVIPEEYEKCK
jgi:hypothetical protein